MEINIGDNDSDVSVLDIENMSFASGSSVSIESNNSYLPSDPSFDTNTNSFTENGMVHEI